MAKGDERTEMISTQIEPGLQNIAAIPPDFARRLLSSQDPSGVIFLYFSIQQRCVLEFRTVEWGAKVPANCFWGERRCKPP